MGGVDQNDQLRGYYNVRLKCRKYYKYIFWFLFDLAITNSYILTKRHTDLNSRQRPDLSHQSNGTRPMINLSFSVTPIRGLSLSNHCNFFFPLSSATFLSSCNLAFHHILLPLATNYSSICLPFLLQMMSDKPSLLFGLAGVDSSWISYCLIIALYTGTTFVYYAKCYTD